MKTKRNQYSSCSKCLEQVMKQHEFPDNPKNWDLIGRDLAHCQTCIKALKEAYSKREPSRVSV